LVTVLLTTTASPVRAWRGAEPRISPSGGVHLMARVDDHGEGLGDL